MSKAERLPALNARPLLLCDTLPNWHTGKPPRFRPLSEGPRPTQQHCFFLMPVSTDLQALAVSELYGWLQLAQEDLDQARTFEDEIEAEAMCDVIVSEIVQRVAA